MKLRKMCERPRVRNTTRTNQRGQLLAEAVVVLGVAVVFFAAVKTTSRLQLGWHEDLLHGHQVAKAAATGHVRVADASLVDTVMRSGSVMGLLRNVAGQATRTDRHAAGFDEVVGTPSHHGVSGSADLQSLLDGPVRWVHVQTRSKFGNHAWHVRGTGEIATTLETIPRIEGAEELWQSAARNSQIQTTMLTPGIVAMEHPWSRPPPTTDWLASWHDVEDGERSTTEVLKEMATNVLEALIPL